MGPISGILIVPWKVAEMSMCRCHRWRRESEGWRSWLQRTQQLQQQHRKLLPSQLQPQMSTWRQLMQLPQVCSSCNCSIDACMLSFAHASLSCPSIPLAAIF